MTKYLLFLRIAIVIAFFVNITALFLTHHGMARLPCEPLHVLQANNFWCIGELNPVATHAMTFGFWGHFSVQLIVWGLAFLWWERRILRREVWQRFAWIPALGLVFLLSLDMFNDIYVLTDTLSKAAGL